MTDELENLVPKDQPIPAEKSDAIVILEDKKQETKAGETPPVTVIESVPKDAATEGVEALAKNLEKAKKEAETERTARIAAESRATEAETKVSTAETKITVQQQQNIDANRTAATNAKAAAQADLEKYTNEAADLMAEGKFREAEQIRIKAFKADQAITHADGYLSQLDRAVETIKTAKPQEQEKPKSDSAGTVDSVTGVKFTPKTYDYIQAQGDNWKDQDFRVACDAANKAATRKGIKPDTDEWVEFMDAKLIALGFKDEPTQGDEVTVEPETKSQPKVSPAVKKPSGASVSPAPSRAVLGSSGVAKKGVKLSGAERDVAQAIVDSVPELFAGENPDQLYARNKQALIDEYGEDHFRVPTNNGA